MTNFCTTLSMGDMDLADRPRAPRSAYTSDHGVHAMKDNTAHFQGAPPRNLRIPQSEFTAAEGIAFLPNLPRSHDVVNRLVTNGMTTEIATRMIDYYRISNKGEIQNNAVHHIIKKAMRVMGYTITNKGYIVGDFRSDKSTKEEWTITKHNTKVVKNLFGKWDHSNISLKGTCLQCEYDIKSVKKKESVIQSIPFHELLRGVRFWPSFATGDGHNLTSCAMWVKDNPLQQNGEPWMFPRDYNVVLSTVGDLPAQKLHQDAAVFERWHEGPPIEAERVAVTFGPTKVAEISKPNLQINFPTISAAALMTPPNTLQQASLTAFGPLIGWSPPQDQAEDTNSSAFQNLDESQSHLFEPIRTLSQQRNFRC